jgi:excisionase family DNA binding protein
MTRTEITVAETARRLGVALTYVYSLLWAGKLKAHKVNRKWKVSAEAVENRLKARGE